MVSIDLRANIARGVAGRLEALEFEVLCQVLAFHNSGRGNAGKGSEGNDELHFGFVVCNER